ncbi:hypothetical protein HK101_007063, partial [Irineochytrium annulatum]
MDDSITALETTSSELKTGRRRVPRLFPEIWTRIFNKACWDLACLARTTALNREIRGRCYSSPRSKCDFVLAHSGNVPTQALALLSRSPLLPDLIDCMRYLVRQGATYDCSRGECGGRRRKFCLLRRLVERRDAAAVITACVNDDGLREGIKFGAYYDCQLALRRATAKSNLELMTVLRDLASGSVPAWWTEMIRGGVDSAAASGMAGRLARSV